MNAPGCTVGEGCTICSDPRYFVGKRLRAWCGPCWVDQIADALRGVGATDVVEGTEHVYCTFPGLSAEHAAARLGDALGGRFGLIFRAV